MNMIRRLPKSIIVKVFLFVVLGQPIYVQKSSAENRKIEIKQKRFSSVRFDPSYYYNTDLGVKDLCEELVEKWQKAGINAVYFKAYDPIYGAVYKTTYTHNVQTDYGRLDLLTAMIETCHRNNIHLYAWIPAFQHKQAWLANSDWRIKMSDGSDYQPSPDSYMLCVRNLEFRKWWIGFIFNIIEQYKDIDGIDIAEPIITWKQYEGCFCTVCREAFKDETSKSAQKRKNNISVIRSVPLTSLLEETSNLVHSYGKSVSVTTIATAHKNGSLYTPEEQRFLTGFDLNGILDSKNKPDIINVELIYQQWAEMYKDTVSFSPDWTEKAVREVISQVNDRAYLVVHIELTSFGKIAITEKQFVECIKTAFDAGALGIDFYDSYQADRQGVWSGIREAFKYIPARKVVIYYDPDGENDARQLEVLMRHFNTKTVLIPLVERFSLYKDAETDIIFYVGIFIRESLPSNFIRYLFRTKKTVCWLNYNINYAGQKNLSKLGFQYQNLDKNSKYKIYYKGMDFIKTNSSMNIIRIDDTDKCRILATAKTNDIEIPYIIRSGNFWYVADLPSTYVVEGGRHIVFSDLLHDILREDHEEKHLALVRIEDINIESYPNVLRDIADYLESKNVPFTVGITPFFLDPSTNTALSLSDKPELVKALHHVTSKGGTIVLHGCTHQYRGRTTDDYEFWDGLNDQPIFQDSEKYVQDRIEKALRECYKCKIYPLVWETPHYAASLLDYSVINKYFSTSYERRQTVDFLGSDQLLPYFIPADKNGNQIIPENLGYIPFDNPSPEEVVYGAERNLTVRDGFASFFFHPFVELTVLKELVEKVQDLGYSFADVRSLNNRVVSSSAVVSTGNTELTLNLQEQYLNEFYITSTGKVKNHSTSKQKLSGEITKEAFCSPGDVYVTRAVDAKMLSFPSNIWASISNSLQAGKLWQPSPLEGINQSAVPLILIDPNAQGEMSIDQSSFLSAFESVGIDYQTISVFDFLEIPEGINLVVIPYTAGRKLTEQQTLFILGALVKGMNLILEKDSDLSVRIGITLVGEEKEVKYVRDEYFPQVDIYWRKKDSYKDIEVPIEYVTYYSERNTDDPIVIGGEYGEGKYLYFATLFDPITSLGYGRFPYFIDLIQRQFDLWPTIKREYAETYFEPGAREDVSIEDLVKVWKKSGYRKIYVAGWHVYPKWIYDYGRLIELAHQNAMLVYLWLELPHVHQSFWEAHPEWREVTAIGNEAVIDWRRLMALEDKSCREAVFNELSNMIQNYDWDGINLAELYFESDYNWDSYIPIPLGPEGPKNFTPMHPSVRESFKSQYGFDPIKLFDTSSSYYWRRNAEKWNIFEEFRKGLVVQLHHEFLNFLHQEIKQKGDNLEIIVTIIDDILSKNIGTGLGIDTRQLITLENELPFTLQIEDPAQLWPSGPFRYANLSQTYRPLMTNKDFILDINIVPFRHLEKSLAPTKQQTGVEMSQLIRFALQDSNRVALYSESTIYEADLPWIAYALGRNTNENFSPQKWEIKSPNTVVLYLDQEQHKDILLDDNLWPAYYKGKAILPSGTHVIRSINQVKNLTTILKTTARLVDISGELKSCKMLSRGIEICYDSSVRNYVIVNERPREIFVDRKIYKTDISHGIPGFSVKLPSGSHTATIYTRSAGSLSLKNFSIVTSVLIVSLSSIAGSVLLVLYTTGYRRRRRRNNMK